MAGVFNLAPVLELVVNRFNQCPLAQQNLVNQLDQSVFHVLFGLGDELPTALVQRLKQGLRDIATVAKKLAQQVLGHVRHRFAVVGVSGCQFEGQQLTLVVDNQVEFEAKVPAHRVLTPLRLPWKNFVRMDTAAVAEVQRGGVNERDACAVTFAGVQEAAQEHHAPGQQLDKPTVADQVGKRMSPVWQDAQGVKLFEGTNTRAVKSNGDRHHFAQAQTGVAPAFTRPRGQLGLVLPAVLEVLIKIVQFTEKACNIEARDEGVHS